MIINENERKIFKDLFNVDQMLETQVRNPNEALQGFIIVNEVAYNLGKEND